MSLANAAWLAAIASVLEFGYWVVSSVLVLRHAPFQDNLPLRFSASLFCTTSTASILFLFLL